MKRLQTSLKEMTHFFVPNMKGVMITPSVIIITMSHHEPGNRFLSMFQSHFSK